MIDAKAADAASRVVIASNQLVLIVPADAAEPIAGFSELADAHVKRIAIGQPRTVPAGEYAAQVLRKLNLFDAVRERLIYGTNVRQVLDYVRRSEVDAGVVYATDAMVEPKVKVVATAEASLHDPIVYPAVIIPRRKGNEPGARKFLEHLQSEAAQKVLRARGFAPTTKPSAAPAP
jgi:molybdate transport system substrate-binding protein